MHQAINRIVRGLLLACAVASGAMPFAGRADARESGVNINPDGNYRLVSKDVAGERWAMTYDVGSNAITGNVFATDGGAPKFVRCSVLSQDAQGGVTAECKGADACSTCPCTNGWTTVGTVTLPGSFFEDCGDDPTPTPTPGPGGSSVTCGSTVTLVEAISYDYAIVPDLSGVTTEVTYPASVSLPGIASEPPVVGRVTNLTGITDGIFQAADDDTKVSVGLVSLVTPIPQGGFASVRFDCTPGATISTSQFSCSTVGSSSLGLEVSVACGVALTTP